MHLATTCGSVPARRGLRPRALALWLLLGSVSLGLTGGSTAAAAEAEPRVARVAFAEGQTSYLNADADEWTAVDVNAPLVTGDRFYSGSDGRAEIQLPGGVYARLASDTEIELLEVSSQAVQVKVGTGTATFRLREVPAGQHVEFSTPTTAVVARSRGAYRIDVAEDGQTTVTVRDGEADAYVGDERYRLDRGRGARIVDASYVTDDVPPIEVFDATSVRNDSWDDWEAQRAGRIQNASSYQYVDRDVYGAEDLDEYGTWDRNDTYGPIWRPTNVAVGWTPYTQGRWVWQDPWGWTWVDYQPWGWAPSHYGRWVTVQNSWAWAPGPVIAQPAYAPATVGFLGVSVNTPSVSVSVGIGPSVGWVPLGWGEPIVPWWGGVYGARVGQPWWGGWGGPRIVNNNVVKNINNVNVTNINYTNIDRGFTAVSRDSFVRGDMQRLDMPRGRGRDEFRPLRGAPDVIPARESLFAARPDKLRGGRGGGLKPSQEILQRAAVSTRDVPAARPDFGRKLKLIERDKGAPVAPQQLRQMAREGQQGAAATPRVRTVAAKGRTPVVPAVTAQAPERLNGPITRTARQGSPQDERATRGERPGNEQRAAQQRNDGRAPDEASRNAALGERRIPLPGSDATRAEAPQGNDPRRAARDDAAPGRQGRALPQAQQPAQPGQQERATAPSRDEAQRQRVESAQEQRLQRERARAERAQPGAADPRGARAAGPSDQASEQPQAERAQRNAADRAQIDRARAAAQSGRPQRREVQPQAERAIRDQAETRQAEQARQESLQRQQPERAQRDDAGRQQAQRAERAQTERAQAERAQQEGARRQQAEQAQRDSTQRQQAEQARRESQQREQAASARRESEARQQQQAAQAERSRQAGEARQRQADAQHQREAAQAQREQASQRQAAERQQAQRQQAERQQAQRQQTQRQQAQRQQVERQQAQRQPAERQGQGDDPRSAQRPDKKQQQRRPMPEG